MRVGQGKGAVRPRAYGPDADTTSFGNLASLRLDEYRANGRKSLDRMEDAVDHLREFFAGCRAQAISTERTLAYVRHRQEQQTAHATTERGRARATPTPPPREQAPKGLRQASQHL